MKKLLFIIVLASIYNIAISQQMNLINTPACGFYSTTGKKMAESFSITWALGDVLIDSYFMKSKPNAIEPTTTAISINVFPNPTSDYINISSDNTDKKIYNLFDTNGRLVLTTNENRINVSQLKSALYILQVKTNNYTQSFKIIKN